MMNQVFNAFCVSTYLYRQTMTTIKEVNETVRLVPWLEFVSTEQSLLPELYHLYVSVTPTTPPLPVDEDDSYWAKTFLLNKIAMFRQNHFASGRGILRHQISRTLEFHNAAELRELKTVPNIFRMTLEAAIDEKLKSPTHENRPAVTADETVWQGDRLSLCNTVTDALEDMAVKVERFEAEVLAREKKHSLSRLDKLKAVMGAPKGYCPVVPYVDDAKRSQWSQTGDDGRWMNDDGEVWDEDDHNGMRPFDESGDTESESDSDDDEEGGAGLDEGEPVVRRMVPQSWISMNMDAPARSR
jgi:hypothetical protein